MCLITAVPKGKSKDLKIIESFIYNGMASNTDGSGFAYKRKNGKMFISKGYFEVKTICEAIEKQKLTDDDELIIHHRIATSGKRNAQNMHPFVVSKDEKFSLLTEGPVKMPVLAHNGVFNKFTDRNSEYSDTYNFIQEFLSNDNVLNILREDPYSFSEWFSGILGYQKLAVLMPNRRMVLLGNFIEDDGYFHSNGGYKEYVYDKGGSSSYKNKGKQANIDFDEKKDKKTLVYDGEIKYHPEVGDYITPSQQELSVLPPDFHTRFKWNTRLGKFINVLCPINSNQDKDEDFNHIFDGSILSINERNYNNVYLVPKNKILQLDPSEVYRIENFDRESIFAIVSQVRNKDARCAIRLNDNLKNFKVIFSYNGRKEFSTFLKLLTIYDKKEITSTLAKKIKKAASTSYNKDYVNFKNYGKIDVRDLYRIQYLISESSKEKNKNIKK